MAANTGAVYIFAENTLCIELQEDRIAQFNFAHDAIVTKLPTIQSPIAKNGFASR
jgi:hypothetical protein